METKDNNATILCHDNINTYFKNIGIYTYIYIGTLLIRGYFFFHNYENINIIAFRCLFFCLSYECIAGLFMTLRHRIVLIHLLK